MAKKSITQKQNEDLNKDKSQTGKFISFDDAMNKIAHVKKADIDQHFKATKKK